MVKFFVRLKNDDHGATAIEYGLILALIFLGMMSGVNAFAGSFNAMWNLVGDTYEEGVAMERPPTD